MKNSKNAKTLDSIITKSGDAAKSIKLTRNNTERILDIVKVERKEDKGLQYFGISFDPKGSNLLDILDFIGLDIVAGLLETTVNTKLNTFCEQAIEKVAYSTEKTTVGDTITAKTIDKDFTLTEFTSELTRIITAWSAREVSQKSLMAEMSDLGREIATASVERKIEIMNRLGELAVAIATQAK